MNDPLTQELSPRSSMTPLPSDGSGSKSTFWRFIPTLLRKNWLLKHKQRRALIFELIAPMLFILLLNILKKQTSDSNVPTGFTSGTKSRDLFAAGGSSLVAPDLSPMYAVPETTLTGLLLHLATLSYQRARNMETFDAANQKLCEAQVMFGGRVSLNTSSPYALPSVCEDRISPFKIAIVPDNAFTRNYFFETVKRWYPTVTIDAPSNASYASAASALVVPSFEDSVVFYSSEDELESYVKSKTYAETSTQPRIFGALVFNSYPSSIGQIGSIDYSVRLNSTYVDTDQSVRYVPRTLDKEGASTWDAYQSDLDTTFYEQYAAGGFMTLQTLVTRFANCLPDWNSASKATTGACQVNASTATSSNDLDSQFVTYLGKDPAIKSVWSAFTQPTAAANNSIWVAELAQSSIALPLSNSSREALLLPLRQVPQPALGALVSPFPIQAYISSSFYNTIEDIFPIFFLMTYMLPLAKILMSLIAERETRSRELMKILGVKESSIVTSWYITYALILFVATVLQTLVALTGLFTNSDTVLLWLFFYTFALSVLAFGLAVSSAVSTTRSGLYLGLIAFFAMYSISNLFDDSSAESSKTYACLLPPVAMVFGVNALASVETTHVGMHFSNASLLVDNFRFMTAIYMLLLDFVLYTILALYLEKVVPKDYGTTEKFYFPLKPSFWFKSMRAKRNSSAASDDSLVNATALSVTNPNFEEVSADLRSQEKQQQALSINCLRKVFSVPGGEKVAVKSVSLNLYSNQITCLLGHNGAGKTTLISMLTGVTEPTAGDATFHGLSLSQDMDELRNSLGICFQHDVLYPEMTVAEHLEFYARVKGFRGDLLEQEVVSKMAEVGLTDKKDARSDALSGGMKRKLSVAIALLGDSALVFLDEPTSGMDPYSRRSTWEILMNNRPGRVLVLTTHFMDEADILGDRIAIMAEGEVRCCGSSLFLKNRFGAGYNLTIVKKEGCNDRQVIDFITSRIPSSSVLSNVGTELAVQLPMNTSPQFPQLFRDLDLHLELLQLRTYGISVTTMEEVFIKVAEASDDDHQQHTLQNLVKQHSIPAFLPSSSMDDTIQCAYNKTNSSLPVDEPLPARSEKDVVRGQFKALVQKRFRIAKRDRVLRLTGLYLPVIWLLFGFSTLQASDNKKNDPIMALSAKALAKESTDGKVLLASFCQQSQGDWCTSVLGTNAYFTGATPVEIDVDTIGSPPYTTDTPTVFNVTYTSPAINASNATGYLLKLSEQIYEQGVIQGHVSQFGGLHVHADDSTNVLSYNVLINTTVKHGAAVFKALVDQSIYRLMAKQLDSSADVSALKLTVNSHPLPQTASTSSLMTSYLAFTACMFITIAFAYYPASIVTQLVRERQPTKNAKHQQLISGVSIPVFWAANYAWDLVVYIFPCVMGLVLIQAYNFSTLTGSSGCDTCTSATFPSVVLLMVLFGVAACPYAYAWSFAFTDPGSAQSAIIKINLLLGLVLMIVSFVLDYVSNTTEDINSVLKFVWRLSPLYNLGSGLLNITIIAIVATGEYTTNSSTSKDPFALNNMGYELIFMILDAVLYMALALALDYRSTVPKLKKEEPGLFDTHEVHNGEPVDEDVAAEAARVASGAAQGDAVVLRNLRKVYPSGKLAVQDLSFGLPKGACFGFLGINGAGKTTTMKMLTGDLLPSSGTATLSGFDILSQQIDVRREIGYCPQFDALFDLLSVREHLELFAQLKGVQAADLEMVVQAKMTQLNLSSFEDKLAGSLSGGNKRKLSVAIAMIGSPSILFLDEPSTGMDPVSRRFMWDVIADISTYSKRTTVMLTTHSMEECEALCTRVGIMVNGALQCLGSVQHLKNRFGDGLMFDAKLQPTSKPAVQALALCHFESLDTHIRLEQLASACSTLGEATWAAKIVNTHPTGFTLANQFKRDGYVLAGALTAWWLAEVQFEAVALFLQQNFGQTELLERQNDSCWFKLHGRSGSDDSLRLANVFERAEAAKTQLGISEYSVSQTTLEQIFNSFASQHAADEPFASTPTNSAAKSSEKAHGLLRRLLHF